MNIEAKGIRVLLIKSQLDGHFRGIRDIARALRDKGMEVVLTEFGTPEDVVSCALQEDVDVIGLSFSSGGQVRVTDEVLKLLKEKDMGEKLVIVGGAIPPYDVPKLKEIGVGEVFGAGSRLEQIVNYIRNCVTEKADC